MVEAAATDPAVAQRVRMFRHRAAEEFYNLQNDPDCLKNLIDESECQAELDTMRGQLKDWMKQTHDPLLPAFENRNSPEKLKASLVELYGENYTKATQKRPGARRNKKNTRK